MIFGGIYIFQIFMILKINQNLYFTKDEICKNKLNKQNYFIPFEQHNTTSYKKQAY